MTDWLFSRQWEEARLGTQGQSNVPSFCKQELIERYAQRHGLTLKMAMQKLLGAGIWPERFNRNYGLLAARDQIRILDLPVFIAGCGGLGGEIAEMLVRLGAGCLYLCDYDQFEESNLNRQRFCNDASLGIKKADVTASGLQEIAPFGDYHPVMTRLSPDNATDLIAPCEIVIDCLDSVNGKIMLEQAAAKTGKAFLHGSVLEHEGFAFLASPATGSLSGLYGENVPISGAGSVLSHVVTGTASLMCSLFTRWLTGKLHVSKLLHCDFSVPELDAFQLP